MESLLKKFVTKDKSARNVRDLERHISYWYDWIMNLERMKKNVENEDGTVFARKKIQGLSCASWGTNPVNVFDSPQPNLPWGKMIATFKKKSHKEEESEPNK